MSFFCIRWCVCGWVAAILHLLCGVRDEYSHSLWFLSVRWCKRISLQAVAVAAPAPAHIRLKRFIYNAHGIVRRKLTQANGEFRQKRHVFRTEFKYINEYEMYFIYVKIDRGMVYSGTSNYRNPSVFTRSQAIAECGAECFEHSLAHHSTDWWWSESRWPPPAQSTNAIFWFNASTNSPGNILSESRVYSL